MDLFFFFLTAPQLPHGLKIFTPRERSGQLAPSTAALQPLGQLGLSTASLQPLGQLAPSAAALPPLSTASAGTDEAPKLLQLALTDGAFQNSEAAEGGEANKVGENSDDILHSIQQLAHKAKGKAKAKAKGKAKAKAAQSKAGTSKGKGKDKDNTASTGVKRKFNIAFPGKPKKWVEVQEFGKYKIYTDMKKKAWRVMVVGHKNDKSYGWQTDAKAAWEQMASDLSNGSIGVNWK